MLAGLAPCARTCPAAAARSPGARAGAAGRRPRLVRARARRLGRCRTRRAAGPPAPPAGGSGGRRARTAGRDPCRPRPPPADARSSLPTARQALHLLQGAIRRSHGMRARRLAPAASAAAACPSAGARQAARCGRRPRRARPSTCAASAPAPPRCGPQGGGPAGFQPSPTVRHCAAWRQRRSGLPNLTCRQCLLTLPKKCGARGTRREAAHRGGCGAPGAGSPAARRPPARPQRAVLQGRNRVPGAPAAAWTNRLPVRR